MGLYGAYLGLRGVDPYGSKVLLVLVKALADPNDPDTDPFLDIVRNTYLEDPQAWMEKKQEFLSGGYERNKSFVFAIPEEGYQENKNNYRFNGVVFEGGLRAYQWAVARELDSKSMFLEEATFEKVKDLLVKYAQAEQEKSMEYDEIVLLIHGSEDKKFAFGKERLEMKGAAEKLSEEIYGTGFKGKFKILSCYYQTGNKCTLEITKANIKVGGFNLLKPQVGNRYCEGADATAASVAGVEIEVADPKRFDLPEPRPAPRQPKR